MNKVLAFFKKIQYNSPVVLSFVFISFGVFLLSLMTADSSYGANSSAFSWTNLHFFTVYRGSLADPFSYVRLIGHALGHANLEHYISNVMLLLLVGPMLEEKYGAKNMLLMIIVTTLITALIHILFFPSVVLMGASGIAFMMMLLSSYTNFSEGRIPLTLVLCIIVFIGREILTGMLVEDNISNLTHIVGGMCGALFGYLVNRSKRKKAATVS